MRLPRLALLVLMSVTAMILGLIAAPAANAVTAVPSAVGVSPWKTGDPTFTAPTAKPPVQGVNYHGIWGDRDAATRGKILDQLAAAGVEYVRLDIAWNNIQPSGPDSYDMAYWVPQIDQRMAELRARGMKALLLFYWAPKWAWDPAIPATNSKNGVPRDPQEFGRAAAWAADRWESDLIGMELWNEPDLENFLVNRSPATHAALVKAAYPLIKAVAPTVKVIAGATTYVKDSWWKQFYANGGADHYDALGIHPYIGVSDGAPNACDKNWIESYPCNIPNLIKLMQDNGDGDKTLWATEYGWSSHDNSTYGSSVPVWKKGVTEAKQAQYLVQLQEYVAQWPQVETMFWYNDWNKVTGDAMEDNFGLIKRDFTPKPAYYAMKCVASGVCGPDSSPTPTPTPTATATPTPTATASPTPTPSPSGNGSYVVSGAAWKANDSGADLGTGWKNAGYNDSAWKNARTQMGYGDGDEATALTWGSDSTKKPITVYARTTFDAADIGSVAGLRMKAIIDDAAAVYLNGQEVWRFNLPDGAITSSTKALRYVAGAEESTWQTVDLPKGALQNGTNTLAVEVHQDQPSSSDLSLDLELTPIAATASPTPTPTPTPTVTAPAAPTGLTATADGQNRVALTWATTTGATGYKVFRDGTKIADVTGTSHTDTGLTANTSYTYTVKATNTGGDSPASNPATATTLPNAPAAPTGLTATADGQNRVALTWATTTGATGYKVFRDGTKIADVTGTSHTDTGLTANTSYTYTVKATNTGGDSPASNPATATTLPNAPAAPTGLTATADGQNRVALTWATTTGATGYKVFRDGTKIADVTGTSHTDTGLTANTSYTYTVKATNTGGDSPASNPATATTLPNAPAAPTGLTATADGQNRVALTWATTTGATGYKVFRDGTKIADVTGTSHTDTGLTANTSYTYTVKATNTGGDSPASNPATATTARALITQYLRSGAIWRFNDSGANLGTTWRSTTYNDGTWKSGGSQLGFGDGDEKTVVGWGSNATKKHITTYFRTSFDAGSTVADVTGLNLRALVDDGAVVYLNGTEVWRFNLPTGTISNTTRASRYIAGAEEQQWRTVTLPKSALRAGTNTIAVEVHQDAPSSSDLSLDLELSPQR